jgi:hypothetical protein
MFKIIIYDSKQYFIYVFSRTFFTKVILPSPHKPIGDGVNWYDYINYGPDKMKTNKPEIFDV